ncbi:MAG: serine/threonine-protein kinase, partial [Acidobacteriota bacterium]|nr:serine/threonine-protein kinase [Acidobacteriota bacterium]
PADTLPNARPVFDRYRTIREIGSGGMATVYLADDLKHNRRVAIKVMKPALVEAIGQDRFLREIEIAARLNHPHVVPLFDSGAAGEALFYVMPYVDGESLRARLQREAQLPLDEALRLAREISSALSHAHHHGLVHRDIKPENILLADGIALVADFGIARSCDAGDADRTQAMTVEGGILGTPLYMSPEQACGEPVGPASDVYSLACVVFEMLAGQRPFEASTSESLIRMHLTTPPPGLDTLRPSIPASVARVLARALAKRPEDRYGSAVKFAEALTASAAGDSTLTPPPAADALPASNLPKQRTHFIGRERELAECARLLGETRVLTLTGIGGCGKTRLALKLAEHMLPLFPDGAWFVDLAPLHDGSRVAEAVATSLGIREAAGKPLLDSICEQVGARRLLLILDNCEHLLDDVCRVADRIVSGSAAVRLLVTSREGLGIDGERILPLRSLSVPTAESAPAPAVLREFESVRLFVDRAQRVLRDFEITPANAAGIAEICRRLDGIPLAIELAAARVKVLSIDQIRHRLDDRFRLLTGGSRTALARHQTLQATIEWSHDQLTPGEKQLFCQLAVFSGGWTFETLCSLRSEGTDEFELLDELSRLVDKSLVMVDRRGDSEPRYSLLETVRQFASDRLREAGETDDGRAAHAAEFLALAERAYAGRLTDEDGWSAALEGEHDNLRGALDVLRATNAETHLAMAGALGWFWLGHSYLAEGNGQLAAALAAAPADPPRPARARALSGVAGLLAWQGSTVAAASAWREALEVWREVGNEREMAMALEGAGWADFVAGDDQRAHATFEEYMRVQQATGDTHRIHRAMIGVGQLAVALGRVEQARHCASEILAYCQVHPSTRSEHLAFHYLADCALIERHFAESLRLYRESLRLALLLGDHVEIGFEVQGTAMSLAELGEDETALRLVAGIEADWARIGAGIRVRFWSALIDRHIGAARERLGPRADPVWGEGLQLPFDATIRLAITQVPRGC